MSGIVCAIRGGPASRPTIVRAIALAKETGLELYFLYVVNLDFLSHTSSSRIHTISKEMDQMGEFILLSAQEMAMAQKVTAEGVVRHGTVQDEIISLGKEIEASFVVLGLPRGQREEDVFTREQLSNFIHKIENESGAKVALVEVPEDE
jgi:nucleotide-binding universal stress UspA family protein